MAPTKIEDERRLKRIGRELPNLIEIGKVSTVNRRKVTSKDLHKIVSS